MVNAPTGTITFGTSNITFAVFSTSSVFDAGNGINGQDIPFRLLPALVAGLSYMLAMKLPDAGSRLEMLKAVYDEAWQLASEEDRDKAPVRFVPRESFLR